MCGIFGFVSKVDKNLPISFTDVLRDQTFFSLPRGIDALGFMKVKRTSQQPHVLKESGHPLKLLQTKPYEEFLKWAGDNRFVVGHNRHATKGEKTTLCAHPFIAPKEGAEGKSIVLVHNGTLTHIRDEEKLKARTDSHAITKLLANGMTIKQVYDACWGAMALVWYDEGEYTLNFFRNDDRPFGFAYSNESMWFASELYLVGAAMDRHNVKVTDFEKLKPMEHWTFHLDDFKIEKVVVPKSVSSSSIVTHEHDWEDCIPPYTEDILQEGSKSSEKNENSSPGNNRTAVVPFQDKGGTSTILSSPSASAHEFLPKSRCTERNYKRFDKDRWYRVPDAQGFQRGNVVHFSLCDYVGTKRSHQTMVNGNLVVFGNRAEPISRPTVTINGMIGKTIGDVEKSTGLFKGIITQIEKCEWGAGAYKVRFNVKDISEIEMIDPFRNLMKKEPKLEGCCTDIHQCTEAGKCLLVEAQKPDPKPHITPKTTPQPLLVVENLRIAEEREFADSSVMSGKCSDCGNTFLKTSLQRIKKKEDANSKADSGVMLRLCGPCMKALICDDSRLYRLFDQAKADLDRISTEVRQ